MLTDVVADAILGLLTVAELCKLRTTCRTWWSFTQSARAWQRLCRDDWCAEGVDEDLADNPRRCAWEATYLQRVSRYERYYRHSRGLYPRVHRVWHRLRTWYLEHLAGVLDSLVSALQQAVHVGAPPQLLLFGLQAPTPSDADLDGAEAETGLRWPVEYRLFLLLAGGQAFRVEPWLALFGSFFVYGELAATVLLRVSDIVLLHARLQLERDELLVTVSPSDGKFHVINVADGRLHVLVLTDDGAVRRPAFLAEQPAEQCGFLPWVERFVADVEGGVFGVRQLTLSRPRSGGRATVPHLNLFRQRPPGVTEAVTHGVRIRAAPLCRITGPGTFVWAYEITMSLDADARFSQVQLRSRQWHIAGAGSETEPEVVQGEGVIGLTPVLTAGGPTFSYCSCTSVERLPGTMWGHFVMVPGSLEAPVGPPFNADVPAMTLSLPDVFY